MTLFSLFPQGFLASSQVDCACALGSAVAALCGVVGVYVVIRGQSFAGHALSDVGTTGGSAAFLTGSGNQLFGFVVACLAASGIMEVIGVERARGRDVATGVILGAALGISALLLALVTDSGNSSNVSFIVVFGSIWIVNTASIVPALILGAAALLGLAALSRPLLLASLHPDLAIAKGVPVRLVGVAFLAILSVSVSLSCFTIGAVLSTALLIGPAATATRITARPAAAMALAALLGVLSVLVGVYLAYVSISWPPAGRSWPVSFLIVTLIFAMYAVTLLPWFQQRLGRHKESYA